MFSPQAAKEQPLFYCTCFRVGLTAGLQASPGLLNTTGGAAGWGTLGTKGSGAMRRKEAG